MLIKNGDILLFASFDPQTRKVSTNFNVLSASQLGPEQFGLKEVGPLTPEEPN